MHARKIFLLFPAAALALAMMACSLSSVLFPAPTPGLFDTPTAAPAQPVLAPTTSAPTSELPAADTQAPPVAVVPTNTTAPSSDGGVPTPPPTVVITPLQPLRTIVVASATPLKKPTQPPANITLKITMIAIDDNGASGPKIGCGDSAVAVNITVPYTQAVLRASLTQLLAVRSKDYGQSGLYNALYQSNLTIDSLALQNGEAIIKLKGQLASGGVCDDPRIIAQIERTALQFSTVSKVTIYVNGTKIQDLLSGK